MTMTRSSPAIEVLRDYPISDLKLDPSNPNVMTIQDMKAEQKFLQNVGNFKVVLIDENNIVVDGEHHVRNHIELGKKTLDLVLRYHFKDAVEKKVVRQFINYGPKGVPVKDRQTKELLTIYKSVGFEEFSQMMNKPKDTFLELIRNEPGVSYDRDVFPKKPTTTKIKSGQMFVLGQSRVMCGDSTNSKDVLKLLESDVPRLIFTDPPYDMKEYDYLQPFFDTEKDVEVMILNDDIGTAKLISLYQKFFRGFDVLKLHTSPIGYGNQPLAQHRMISHFRKGKSNFQNLNDGFGTVQEFVIRKDGLVRQEKPVELPRRFIIHYTKPGELVLDLFGGSGSSLIACENTGRNCLVMEKDPAIVDVILDRWSNYTGKDPVRINDDKPWSKIKG